MYPHIWHQGHICGTSVPVDTIINIIKNKLEHDTELLHRTPVSISNINSVFGICLMNTYFLLQGKYYEQVQGATIGSPINSIVANQFMDNFEVRVINTSSYIPRFGRRYVDVTFVIQKTEHRK